MDLDKLHEEIVNDEGIRYFPYKDTVGKLTIGVGRNLSDRGLSKDEMFILLDNDIQDVFIDLDRNLSWWKWISDGRQRALVNMCFNLGLTRLLGFKKMLNAMKIGNYELAADEALNSKWSQQVGMRSVRIAELIRNG
jgi:lysozyme